MERKIKEALHDIVEQHEFSQEVDIQSVLSHKRNKNTHLKFIGPVIACLLLILIFNAPQTIADLLKSEPINHEYSDYLIHNGYYYVPLEQTIEKEKLSNVLGEVTSIGGGAILEEGDTLLYIPGTKYYALKGASNEERIAVEIWGGTKAAPLITGYQVLERRDPLEAVNNNRILGAKGDTTEVGVALENIRKVFQNFSEFKSDELMPFLVSLDNDGNHYSVLTHYIPHSALEKDGNSKVIFFLQYQKGFELKKENGIFNHNSEHTLSTFKVNGISWTQYETDMSSYFQGEKDDLIYVISSQEYTPEKIKWFLETLSSTPE